MRFSRVLVPVVEELDHEAKYLLPAVAAPAARAILGALCRPDASHARSRVGTIYFDTPSLASAHEKWASVYRKEKFRLRWYDGAGIVFLEVKRRIGSRREKLRAAMPLDGTSLERGGLGAAAALDLGEMLITFGLAAHAELAPVLRLDYERERFVDPLFGRRLNLDTGIRSVERAPWADSSSANPEAMGPVGCSAELDLALVEVKGSRRELPPALAVLDDLGARRRSFSKYTACLCGWQL